MGEMLMTYTDIRIRWDGILGGEWTGESGFPPSRE
jgi:hypothetical protein